VEWATFFSAFVTILRRHCTLLVEDSVFAMSTDIHVSRELLRAVYEEDDSAALIQLLAIIHEHLSSLCPTCAEEIEAFTEGQGSSVPFLGTFETVTRALDTLRPLIEEETACVAAFMDSLRQQPAEERWSLIAEAEDLHGRALVSALISEGRSHTPADPMEALLWAQLAEELLRHLGLGADHPDLWVQAIAYQGNAQRQRGQLRAAEREFSRSRLILQSVGVADPAVTAELDSLQASLHIDLHQLEQARLLLQRAALLFKSIRADDQVGRVLIQLGIAHEYDADPMAAMEVTHEALAYLDPDRHRHLYLCAVLSNARYHYAQGDYDTALDIAVYDEDLIETEIAGGNTWLDYNLRWLRGRIAAAREEYSEAESYLTSIREDAIERADPYDAIVVNTELALLCYRRHQNDQALSLAAEALAISQAHELPQHAIAALMLLTDTLRQGEPAAQLLHQVAEFIQKVRWNPKAQFAPDGLPS